MNRKVTFLRILKSGWQTFARNYWLSTATVSVMILALLVISGVSLFNVMTQAVISNLENRVDISVYFNRDTDESKILSIREELVGLEQIKNIDYVSQEQALKSFREKHADNEVLLQSLQELEQNPLEPSLNIKAHYASQYESIANYLNQDRFQGLISKVNYNQNKDIIEKLTNFTGSIEKGGLIISLFLAFIAILVTFNTMRLTMFTWRDEISVMRFVGASNWYVRGPFIVVGVIYGIAAGLTTLILLFPALYLVSPYVTKFLPEIDLLYFYQMNFWEFALLVILIGIFLGGVSSFIAVRRYLRS